MATDEYLTKKPLKAVGTPESHTADSLFTPSSWVAEGRQVLRADNEMHERFFKEPC